MQLAEQTLRIGVDARPLTLPNTGIGRYTREILKRATRAGHDWFLYSHQPFESIATTVKAHVRCGRTESSRLSSLFAQFQFPRWAGKDRLDVFWSPRHHLPLAIHVPTVVTIHDLVWRKAPDSMMPLGRLVERILMPPSLRKADDIIAVSQSTKRDLVEFMPAAEAKIQVIPEAGLVSGRTHDDREPTSSILFVGTFEPRKNIPGILRAFANLVQNGHETHRLVLAGGPGWKLDVDAMVREFALSDRVEVVRPHSQADLENLYQACDFTVQPSFYEGFGLPILEAMSFGKPVITSDVSSMPEVAGDAGLLVDPYDVESIASAMQTLIEDRKLYETLSARAKGQAAKFSWDRAAEETLRVIEDVAKGRR